MKSMIVFGQAQKMLLFLFIIFFAMASSVALADSQKTYTVIDECYGRCIKVKGASNITFRVEYTSPINVKVGNTVTVLFDDDDKPKKITNDQTGDTSQIVYWSN